MTGEHAADALLKAIRDAISEAAEHLDEKVLLAVKRLACPCGDAGGARCHGSVLVRLVEEFCGERT